MLFSPHQQCPALWDVLTGGGHSLATRCHHHHDVCIVHVGAINFDTQSIRRYISHATALIDSMVLMLR